MRKANNRTARAPGPGAGPPGGWDLIGDIHGYADELRGLLEGLGYHCKDGVYRHPNRRALFMGDWIDRGPKIREVLRIVRRMVENGTARAVMGNHEFNLVSLYTPDGAGGYLRPHSPCNLRQHRVTREQFRDADLELAGYLEWFKSLPFYLELGPLRVVHATWHKPSIAFLRGSTLMDNGFLRLAADESRSSPVYTSVKTILGGLRTQLPGDLMAEDPDGNLQRTTRLRWWKDPDPDPALRNWVCPFNGNLDANADLPATARKKLSECGGGHDTDHVFFFGHYWMPPGPPRVFGNRACLDHSVARGGYLAAYRWDGELTLDSEKFVTYPDWRTVTGERKTARATGGKPLIQTGG
jgi:hypothetical protein